MSTRWTWATVTTAGAAYRIRLDGDTNPLPYSPDALTDPTLLALGDRVRVEITDRRLVVHGRGGGDRISPEPAWDGFNPDPAYWSVGGSGWSEPKLRLVGNRLEIVGGSVMRITSAFTIGVSSGLGLMALAGYTSASAQILGLGMVAGNVVVFAVYTSGLHAYNFSAAAITCPINGRLYIPSGFVLI